MPATFGAPRASCSPVRHTGRGEENRAGPNRATRVAAKRCLFSSFPQTRPFDARFPVVPGPRSRNSGGLGPVRVQPFVTCLVDLAFPAVGERTVALLERLGCEVAFPAGQTCCGQPAFNSGHPDAARRVASAFVAAFADTDGPIVAPFGSCVHMVRHSYAGLLPDRPEATAVAARVRDLAAFVVDDLGVRDAGGGPPRAPGPETVAGAWAGRGHP